jgi:xylose isomerase
LAIEPKPNEPRGDILLPTIGHALGLIDRSSTPRWSGSTPRSATSRWPGSTWCTASRRRCGHGKLFHIDLNGQRGPKYDQDLVFGHGDLLNAFFLVDLLETSGYSGMRHFDYKPARTEDSEGVWRSAAANMSTYLMLKQRAAQFRADPEVQAGMAAAGVDTLREPTLNPGETVADLPEITDVDVEALVRGYPFVNLNQLAIEHLMGFRG